MAKSNGRELSASDLATGAEVPLSSGLRLIATLRGLNLVESRVDEKDRRRSIVRLTDTGSHLMATYFDKCLRPGITGLAALCEFGGRPSVVRKGDGQLFAIHSQKPPTGISQCPLLIFCRRRVWQIVSC